MNLKVLRGSRYTLNSLKGIEVFKSLRSIELEGESLEQISELEGAANLEALKLSDDSTHGLTVASLATLPALKSMDLGGHGVSDPKSLLKFRPETAIFLKNLEWMKP